MKNINYFTQPLVTVLLLMGIFLLLFQGWGANNNVEKLVSINENVNFNDVVNNFLNKDYEIFTRGSLYVIAGKDDSKITLVENVYDDIFFILEKGSLKRMNMKNKDVDLSLFFNKDQNLIILNHNSKTYQVYSSNSVLNSNQDIGDITEMIKYFMDNNIFPLIPIIQDFRSNKLNPVQRASNIYVANWKHKVFTSDNVCEIVMALEPNNLTFKSISFTHTQPPSLIYFDFREITSSEIIRSYDKIPQDYTKVD